MNDRPLIVFTGQGLAIADGFNLVERLQAIPELNAAFFTIGKDAPNDLDQVITACRGADEGVFKCLLDHTRRVCREEREKTADKRTHREVFKLLADVARERPVLHLTTNIDGISTSIAVGEFGAIWSPYSVTATIDTIVAETSRVLDEKRGLLHIPVHGEAGLLADGDGAPTLWTLRLGSAGGGNSTLAQGIGRGVARIETLMIASQLGYRLLYALLTGTGTRLDSKHEIRPHALADLVTLGYGAGGSDIRRGYAFEVNLDRLLSGSCPTAPSAWKALVFERADAAVRDWYRSHRFETVPHTASDVIDQFRAAIGPAS